MIKFTLNAKRKAFILFLVLIDWSIACNSQVSGYILEWNGQKVAFSTVSGLNETTQTSIYQNRTLSATNPLTSSVNKTITLQKLQCRSDNELFKWFCSFNQATRQKWDIRIKLINASGETINAWKIIQASPLKTYFPPPLDAEANSIGIESVVLTYEKIERDW